MATEGGFFMRSAVEEVVVPQDHLATVPWEDHLPYLALALAVKVIVGTVVPVVRARQGAPARNGMHLMVPVAAVPARRAAQAAMVVVCMAVAVAVAVALIPAIP